MTISMKTLVKIASIGGIITCTAGLATQWKVKDRIRQTEFYKEALTDLRRHKGAVSLLGEPIKEGNINLKTTKMNTESVELEVNVKGPVQKGTLYFWANKIADSEKWNVSRIELGLEKEADRRLLVKNTEGNTI